MNLGERLIGAGYDIKDILRGKDELNHPVEFLHHLNTLRTLFPELRTIAASHSPVVNPAFSRTRLVEIFACKGLPIKKELKG